MIEKYKVIINEKGLHKDWTQREIALNAMQDYLNNANFEDESVINQDESFFLHCTVVLESAVGDNNI
jgi:hypothetical protein